MSAERQKQTDHSLKYLQDRRLSSVQLAYWVIAALLWGTKSVCKPGGKHSLTTFLLSFCAACVQCVRLISKKKAARTNSFTHKNFSQVKNSGKTSSIFHLLSQQLFLTASLWRSQGLSSKVQYHREMRQHSVSNELLTAATPSLSAGGSIHPSTTSSYCLVHTEQKRDTGVCECFCVLASALECIGLNMNLR